MITETVKQRLQYAHAQGATLYKETSLSGSSETLRYEYLIPSPYGGYPGRKTGMVLSVTIHTLPNRQDDPKDWEKYEKMCEAAEEYYRSL